MAALKKETINSGQFKEKHGLSKSRLYRIRGGMLSRCLNPKNTKFHLYGGRGISVCDIWLKSFQAFYDWAMANGYSDELSLDRINNNGNYEPSNCRWVTISEQNKNRRPYKWKSKEN